MVNGRPRKTQEELDREMEDYWSLRESANGKQNENGAATAPVDVDDGDIDMIT